MRCWRFVAALCCVSNSMYFNGGVHTYAALRVVCCASENAACFTSETQQRAAYMCERPFNLKRTRGVNATTVCITGRIPAGCRLQVFWCVDQSCPSAGNPWAAARRSERARVESQDCSPSLSYTRTTPTRTNTQCIRYDTRCYFNVRSKADISQLSLPHGTDN